MQKKRIFMWDNIKFLLIILVVIGHFVNPYTKNSGIFKSIFIWIYAFHMPLFILISGMFHKNERIVEKVFSYIMIGVLCRTLISVVQASLAGKKLKINYFSEESVPWFMYALAAFVLLQYLLRNVDQRKVLVLSIIFACMAGYDSSIGDFLCVSRIIVFYPFYVMGGMINKEFLLRQSEKKQYKVLGGTILAVWGLLCIFALDVCYKLRPIMTARNSYSKLDSFYAWGGGVRLFWFALSFILCLAVIWVTPTKKIPVISGFGTRTLQVFFWHKALLVVLLAFPFVDIMVATGTGKIIYMVLALGVTFVCSLKPFAFPTKWIMKH